MKNRLVTLALAVVTGAIAVTLVYMYVNRVEDTSTQGLKTRAVLVATRFLPSGTSGSEILGARAFETRNVPERYIAPGAFSSPEQLSELTLADDVAAGEQLSSQRFGASEQDAFLSQFPEGTEALALPLDYVRGVAGHLEAGDEINAFVTAEAEDAAGRALRGAGVPSSAGVFSPGESGVTLLLLKRVPLIEVQPSPDGGSTAGTMTLAVTPKEAALLVHSQEKAKLWFSLVPHKGGE
ncbi:MAG: Flp pilus assembly protein CpaB [Actinomycetota bacterium]